MIESAKNFQGGGNRIKPGVHIFYLAGVDVSKTSEKSKRPGRVMLALKWQDEKMNHDPIVERFFVEGSENYVDISLQKLVNRAEHIGISTLGELEDEKALVKWWNTGLNKKLKLAIGSRARIFETENQGKLQLRIVWDPEVAYSGKTTDDLESNFDIGKYTKGLSEERQAYFDQMTGGGEKKKEVSYNIPDIDGGNNTDDLEAPFEEPEKQPAKPAAKKAEEPVQAPADDLDGLTL